jgi:hypothetical protein
MQERSTAKMTLFSFEVPLKHLEDFDHLQDFHFSLSFLYKYPEYKEFMLNTKKELWLDNSTNELKEPDSCSLLSALSNEVNAVKVIAPDHPDWNQETMLNSFLSLQKCGVPSEKICVIIHHPDWIGHFKSYGVRHFAVPYDFRYCTREKLKRFGECHFLGLLSIQELKIAKPTTCDTSMPIKLALLGQTMQDWMVNGCPHLHSTPHFFDLTLSIKEVRLAKENIQELRRLLDEEDQVNHPKHYTQGSIEVLDFITDQKLPYLPSTVLKYICRYRFKGGLEDLKKARFYLDYLIKECENESTSS